MVDINKELEILNDNYMKVQREVLKEKDVLETKLSNAYEKRKNYANLIAKYSIFPIEIGKILADVLETFRGEDYECFDGFHKQVLIVKSNIYSFLRVIADDVNLYAFRDDLVSNWVKHYLCIPLNFDSDKTVAFCYCTNDGIRWINGLDKIKEEDRNLIINFITFVIGYRIENKLDKITMENLEKIKLLYFKDKAKDLEEVYKIFDNQEKEQLERRKNIRKLFLKKMLD